MWCLLEQTEVYGVQCGMFKTSTAVHKLDVYIQYVMLSRYNTYMHIAYVHPYLLYEGCTL